MKLKLNNEYKTLSLSDDMDDIKVSQYLPIKDKYDLVMVTLQNSKEDAIYNPIKLEYFFHLYLVYMYTDISFTEKQKEDPEKIYDVLVSNGIMDKIVELIPDSEYTYLKDVIETTAKDMEDYNSRAGGAIRSLINDLPEQANTFVEIMENFNPEQFQNVIDFATVANGGRDIKTNQPVES
jgi:hypothetical protein